MKKFFFLACAALALVACTDKPEPAPKASLSISPMVNYIECGAQDVELSIKSTDSWTAELTGWSNEEETEWATLNAEGGDGDFTLVVSVENATSLTEERFVFVTVKTASKTVESKITQKTLTLGEGEVLIEGIIWSIYPLGEPGKFATDIEDVSHVYMFNSKKCWVVDPAVNKTTPVDGYVDAVKAYDPGCSGDEWIENAWAPENDPCPEGWRVATGNEIYAILGERGTDESGPGIELPKAKYARIDAGQQGFTKYGLVAGINPALVNEVTKDNITEKGGLYIPNSGWITADGLWDRDWLCVVRTASWCNATHAGMYMSDAWWYNDIWGYGDGQPERASTIRCVKK